MTPTWEIVYRVAVTVGLAAFLWSVASSIEQIAKAFTRMAESRRLDRPTDTSTPPSTT